jgi:hypothetical protein
MITLSAILLGCAPSCLLFIRGSYPGLPTLRITAMLRLQPERCAYLANHKAAAIIDVRPMIGSKLSDFSLIEHA